ncbi:phosphoenolpyruvate--protein phosphotransferase [Luteococcus japonicus]|uniref:Phosphoenolpyruvate-protein phosphotransferase n=1 Tax=Luteococcus japonicus LSP_Lj1 TaxID=1255658 RepID=A0A1R4IH88_9ACTN|nr:phosphoenolpyruvate--protein phosphotransferase [Luteococcus japonicus]SJN19135.1 Phosphoenolpyruvate-protein phosphotransferase of PTS system [Luteococcus japonicus LSP_Lj1]
MSSAAELRGTGVVPGVAYAPAIWTAPRPQLPEHSPNIAEEGREAEVGKLQAAAAAVSSRLAQRASHATGVAANVLEANASMASDKGWHKAIIKKIKTGMPSHLAVARATDEFVTMFEKIGGLMAERTTDLKDIRDRVIAELLGKPEPGVPTPEFPSILLADDLAPADTAGLDPTLVIGLVTELGGPTSHTAIISRQLGIPCIVAVNGLQHVAAGTDLLIDGAAGTLKTGVDAAEAEALVKADFERREAIRSWRGPAQLADGTPVDVLANVQDGAGAGRAAASEAAGIGLFRTELCFLSAENEPSIEEQAKIYREVIGAFPGKKVVVRTLDAGSDKPLKFANFDEEENPAMGVRGVRIAENQPALLTNQLDAVKAASDGNPTWVMAPMIATIEEAKSFAELCRVRGLKPGVMVEVPAVAVQAEKFLEHVEFMSIGTNDLTQYTMAADRMSPKLARLTDPWQPAVLALIGMTAAAGQKTGKPVGVCGEAAADPFLACVLVGLGVTSLSMAVAAIPAVGAQLAKVTPEQCKAAAEAVLGASDTAQARELARAALS